MTDAGWKLKTYRCAITETLKSGTKRTLLKDRVRAPNASEARLVLRRRYLDLRKGNGWPLIEFCTETSRKVK